MKLYFTALAALMVSAMSLRAQTAAFTYQGVLNNGSNTVTGAYDFRFHIYNAGSAVVAGPLTNAPVGVTNGLFTVLLNFNTNVFDGSLRTLEIGVRVYTTNSNTNAYIVLAPRQALTAVPYAIQALNASNAVALTAPLSTTNLTGTIPNSLLSASVAILTNDVVFAKSVTAASFTGNGFGLTNLQATNLVGTIPNSRLSAEVAILTNDVIFAKTVTAAQFNGSGYGLFNVPGAMFWVIATNNTTAQPNFGYICTNDLNMVTIRLPSTLNAGDVFRVAGVGAGGWVIAQTATQQVILTGNLSDSVGASWTARGIVANWSSVASSGDGSKLVATVKGGQIYTSADSGVTWTQHGISTNWSSVASSVDGTNLVAVVGDNSSLVGDVYTSGNSGSSWSPSGAGYRQWVSVASSADGSKRVAAVYGLQGNGNPGFYVNNVQRLAAQFCRSVASSADGSKMVGVIYGGQIYTSINSGLNWGAHETSRNWTAVASSAEGSRLLAAVNNGPLYVSADYGTNWAPVSTSLPWTAVASSADGSRLVAVASSGEVYTSSDSGSVWVQRLGLPTASWTGAACSADGSKLAVVASGDRIYTSSQGTTTTGTNGYVSGARLSAIELQCVGNGVFLPLSHEGALRAY